MAEVEGGYILLSRKLIESEIWDKPPLYLKVWIYILTKAQHKPYKKLSRGELLISIPELIEVCSYKVGYRVEKPTKSQIFNILEWLRSPHEDGYEGDANGTMINTTKTTRGMVVKVCNYNVYQDPKKYEHNDEDNDEKPTNTTMPKRQGDTINKNDKNDKNDKTPRKKRTYEEDSVEYLLAKQLFDRIKENNPEHKEPNLQKWANDVRLMIERDSRVPEKISGMIDWSQQDDFWSTNILSTSSLRRNYDKMNAKAAKDLRAKTDRKTKREDGQAWKKEIEEMMK